MGSSKHVFEIVHTPDSMEFVFSSTFENIDDACEKALDYLSSRIANIKPMLFSINLVIREGLTNAVRHGNGNDPEKLVHFFVNIVEDRLIQLVIKDEGKGFDWRRQKLARLPDDAEHGRGISIIGTYFNDYYYNDAGNILYLEKDISPLS